MKKLTLVGVCMALAAPAYAQMAMVGDALPAFERIDGNGDGIVSREELDRVRDVRFARLDRNSDGVISTGEVIARQDLIQMRSELRQARLALTAARLDSDADGDGGISEDEAQHARQRLSALRP